MKPLLVAPELESLFSAARAISPGKVTVSINGAVTSWASTTNPGGCSVYIIIEEYNYDQETENDRS